MIKFYQYKTRAELLKKENLSCDNITQKVEGGYLVFDTAEELRIWKNQK